MLFSPVQFNRRTVWLILTIRGKTTVIFHQTSYSRIGTQTTMRRRIIQLTRTVDLSFPVRTTKNWIVPASSSQCRKRRMVPMSPAEAKRTPQDRQNAWYAADSVSTFPDGVFATVGRHDVRTARVPDGQS